MIEGEEVSLKPELVSKTAFLYVSTLGSAALAYIALFFATRFVGIYSYGILAFTLSFAGLFLFMTDLGLSSSHTKKVSEGVDLQSCLSVYMLTRLALIAIYAALVFAALFFYEDVLGQQFGDPQTHTVILIVLLYYVTASITYVFSSTFLAQRDVVRAQAIALSDVLVRALGTLLVVAFGLGLVGLAWTYAAEGVVTLGVALVLARKRLPKIRLSAAHRALMKQYISFATPLAIAMIFGTIVLYLDKVLIQYSVHDASQTGVYFAAQRMLQFYLALSPVIASVAYPAMSQLSGRKDGSEQISRMTTTMIRYLLLVTVPAMFFLVMFSGNILGIFLSSSFETGAVAFSILVIGYSIGLTISPFSSQTLGMGLSSTYAKYQITSLIVVIVLDFILIPRNVLSIPLAGWGMNGAAVSLLVGNLMTTSLFYMNARRILQLKVPKGILRISGSAAVAILVVYGLSTFMNMTRFWDVLALFLLYCGIFLGLAVLTKAITHQELRELINMLRSKHLLHRPQK